MVRLLTWNVNGLRAILKRRFGSLAALLNHLQADIICFQETKLTRLELEREFALVDGWESFFVFCRTRTGYSGVATFCRAGIAVPVAAQEGITGVLCLEASSGGADAGALANCYGELHARFSQEELKDIDNEGRCVITDHGSFVLFNIYGPALSMEDNIEARFAYKLRFYEALQCRADALRAAGRRVIITGDLNISPAKIDLCDPAEQFEERRDRKWLHCWLTDGGGPFVDVFRQFHPNRKDAYTCWNTATGARVNNYGTRIDLILAADAQRAQHAQPPAAQTSQPSQPGSQPRADADAFTELDWRAATTQPGDPSPPSAQHESASGLVVAPAQAGGSSAGAHAALQQAACTGARAPHQASSAGACSAAALVQAGSTPAASTPPPPQAEDAANGAAGMRFRDMFVGADIWPECEGSDHAPAWADLAMPEPLPQPATVPALSTCYMFTGKQATLRSWLSSCPPPSASRQPGNVLPASQISASTASQPEAGKGQLASSGSGLAAQSSSGQLLRGQATSQKPALAGKAASSGLSKLPGKGKGKTAAAKVDDKGQRSMKAFIKPVPVPAVAAAAAAANGAAATAGPSRDPPPSQASAALSQTPQGLSGAQHQLLAPRSGPFLSQRAWGAAPDLAAASSQRGSVGPPAGSSAPPSGAPAVTNEGPTVLAEGPGSQHGSQGPSWSSLPWDDQSGNAAGPSSSTAGPAQPDVPSWRLEPSGVFQAEEADYEDPGSTLQGTQYSRMTGERSDGAVRSHSGMDSASGFGNPQQSSLVKESIETAYTHASLNPGNGSVDGSTRQVSLADNSGAVHSQHGVDLGNGVASLQQGSLAGNEARAASHSQAAAADAWKRIQQTMKAPSCKGHKEPCVIRKVKKPGPNQGRLFYVCARPDGPPPIGRCNHFEWSGTREYRDKAAAPVSKKRKK